MRSGDDYDVDMAERCEKDAAHITAELMDYGVTPENQANVMRQFCVNAAQVIIGRQVLPEWRASEQASGVLEAMAQEIADAMQAVRGGQVRPG